MFAATLAARMAHPGLFAGGSIRAKSIQAGAASDHSSALAPASARTRASSAASSCAGAGIDDDAVVEHIGVVGDFEAHARILLDQQHRNALGLRICCDDAEHLAHDQRRQPLRRLVENQELGIEQQRAGDRQHFLLAAGKLTAAIELALGEAREQLVDALDGPRARHARAEP